MGERSLNNLLKNNPLWIVDVGASGGVDPKYETHTSCFKAVLFEPNPDDYKKIEEGGSENLVVLNAALSDSAREIDFYLSGEQSSVYLPNYDFLNKFTDSKRYNTTAVIKIKTDTLDNQMQKNSISEIDFIKIDTQGHELSILKGAENILKGTVGLKLEIAFAPVYKDQPLFWEVDSFARKMGFELFDIKRYFWKRDGVENRGSRKGQLVFGDALYLRTPEEIMSMVGIKEDKIVKSMCIYLIYGYLDLAQTLFNRARKEGVLSKETCEAALAVFSQFEEKNRVPNFRGKRRIRNFLQKVTDVFSDKGPYVGTDRMLGNP